MRPAGPLDFLAVDAALASYRDRVGGGPEYDAWQASFWTRFGGEPPLAYVEGDRVYLVDGSATHRIVLNAGAADLPAIAAHLAAIPEVRAMSVTDAGGMAGFREVERFEHRFDLTFTPATPAPAPAGFEIAAWDAGRSAEAADLLAATNGATLDGLYLTWPDAPTPETCRRVLDGLAAGSHGPFSAETSFMAWHGGRLAGLTLVTLPDSADALLFEIAIRFRYRGTGLAPHLLDRIKTTLRPRGFEGVRFLACGRNAAVLALFRPEEVSSRLLDRGWVWMRG